MYNVYTKHLIVFPKGTIQDNNKRNNIHLYIEYISKCQARVNAVFFIVLIFFLTHVKHEKIFFLFVQKFKWSSLNDRKLGQIEKLCRGLTRN